MHSVVLQDNNICFYEKLFAVFHETVMTSIDEILNFH
ncbi:hypothetical protein T11_2389 [Trichinella zimbabwensis]|uniref:Uncharacterized protein n=1 Tax=Trichinella zimbabwensis TaxID=268475 RepID=A0A0V1G7T6_9BILA|nr:hypothetical protein T11_2389 [Trichinella zimbabwensis]